jgi:hypothetical protein
VFKTCLYCGKIMKVIRCNKRFCDDKCYEKWSKKDFEAHRKRLDVYRRYRERNPEKVRLRNKEFYRQSHPMRETHLNSSLRQEFSDVIIFKEMTPDAYIPKLKTFVEVKLASSKRKHDYTLLSKHFKGLFFQQWRTRKRNRRSIDEQIVQYPKPLLVIIFDMQTGKELTRQLFE